MTYDESQCPLPPHRGGEGNGRAHDERIRELEAELKQAWLAEPTMWRARAEKAEARVEELDALLKEWLETPYFETFVQWQEWIDDFRPRVVEAREREAE